MTETEAMLTISKYIDEQGDLTNCGFVAVSKGLTIIQAACHRRAVSKGWWESGDRNMGEMIALMHSELSEALEAYRGSEPVIWYDYGQNHGKPSGGNLDTQASMPEDAVTVGDSDPSRDVLGKPQGLASEFADVLIRIFDTCEKLEIPLTAALLDKHAYNGTRPYRHGGKLA